MREVRTLFVDAGEDGVRLDRWFKRRWPHISHIQVQKLARSGQIRVDGARAKADDRLTAGAQIRVPPLPDAPREDDAWQEAQALVGTIEDHELVDPQVSSERLLYRLFHERGARVFEPTLVHEACRCSRERVLGMLRGFSAEDRKAMVADDGTLGVTCEFCSRRYVFEATEVEDGPSAT